CGSAVGFANRKFEVGSSKYEVRQRPYFVLPTSYFMLTYFEYNSTISCSCTGRLICSRVGIELTRPLIVFASNDSHSGMPRPLTSSMACSTVGFFCVRPSTVITSPSLTEYDGMSTFLPFTRK